MASAVVVGVGTCGCLPCVAAPYFEWENEGFVARGGPMLRTAGAWCLVPGACWVVDRDSARDLLDRGRGPNISAPLHRRATVSRCRLHPFGSEAPPTTGRVFVPAASIRTR